MSDQVPTSPDPLSTITTVARKDLAKLSTTPFSEAGFQTLQQKIEQHISDLVVEAVRVMQRKQADAVSSAFVQQAAENISTNTRKKRYALAGTLGGILLGAALSAYADMIKGGDLRIAWVLYASAMAVVGSILIAIQFAAQ